MLTMWGDKSSVYSLLTEQQNPLFATDGAWLLRRHPTMQKTADNPGRRRSVRSFVRRAGRITTAQKRALHDLWPIYGIDYEAVELDPDELFGRAANRVMEIGFGNGELLVAIAAENPGTDFIGVEVHEPGVGHCLLALERDDLKNVRISCHDATEVLRTQIPDRSLNAVHLYFPDPWPKKRHHKRRIFQPGFVDLLSRKIAPHGTLHTATDWPEYAEHIEATVLENKGFQRFEGTPALRPATKFEQRGKRLGHRITERIFERL